MADTECTPNGKKKLLDHISWRDVSYMTTLIVVAVSVVVFFWRSQAAQDAVVAGEQTHISMVETALQGHLETSNKIFASIDRTLIAQQQLVADTREKLSGVHATQVAIKEENGRLTATIRELTREIRKSNGHVQ